MWLIGKLRAVRRRGARLRDRFLWRPAYRWSLRSWFVPGDVAASQILLRTFRPSRMLRPEPVAAPRGERILLVAPHPDDESIGAGGTLLLAADADSSVDILFLTTGRTHEREVRRDEALAVCRTAGFSGAFAEKDADAIDVEAAARALVARLGERQFDTLFVPFFLDDHDDHRRANEVLLRALVVGPGDMSLPRTVWAYHVYGPGPMNCIVDIGDVVTRKRELIACHRSQMAGRDWAHFALGLNAVLSRFLPGNPAPGYAEGFMVLPLEEYLDLVREALSCGLYIEGADKAVVQ